MDYHELRTMTAAQLRNVAKDIEGVTGYSRMHKDKLLALICKALQLAMHDHHEVVGIDKAAVKTRIRELKLERGAALEAHDKAELKRVRDQIHGLKRQLRRATV